MKKLLYLLTLSLFASPLFGQAISSNGGSIQGTVSDPTGAAIPGAAVSIVSPDTGFARSLQSDSAGFYSIGPLNPGGYIVTITAPNFSSVKLTTVVRTGTVTSGNAKLVLGKSNETIDVNAGQIQINTDQVGVQDVLTREQVESLPINGRNFLDLAQLQPGVILQSGETFDPTKAGYSAISVDGVSGRTTRILYDGQDITDETVGTTIVNVPTGAVDEFQLNRSTQDVSGEVTSTGQVLVSSPAGTNKIHGQLFYNFQDYRAGFAVTADGNASPFQRNQFGGSVGGPIIKDKLFFFADSERIKQDQSASTTGTTFRDPTLIAGDPAITTPILVQYPSIGEPFRDTFSMARLDYNGPFKGHYFVRAFYEDNAAFGNYNELFSTFSNRDNVPGIVGGVDFTTGRFTHSFRFGYEKFHNLIGDTTKGNTSIYNPNNGLELADAADGFYAGPNFLAPQGTYQSDKQFRYDGTFTKGRHSIKYGASLNRILGGGFAAFFSQAPQIAFDSNTALSNCAGTGASACLGDPLNGYNSQGGIVFGNGNGIFTEQPGFGLPGGGVHDWRSAYYAADTWKATSSLTIVAGLRYSIDTDRANQDLAPPTCDSAIANGFTLNCSGSQPLLAQFSPILSTRVHQPYGNVAPQAGLNFSPGDHKLALRLGAGMFFENDIFNNTGNARPPVVNASGPFFGDAAICGQSGYSLALPGGTTLTSINGQSIQNVCNLPISQAAPYITALNTAYQSATKANSSAANPSYIGNYLSTIVGQPYGSPYRTPYSIQFNGGVQYQIARGTIISADYLHNGTIHVPLVIDLNHLGSANNLNVAAAKNAIAATLKACGAASIQIAITPGGCPGGSGTLANGMPNKAATIVDFAGNGLDSSSSYLSGLPAQFFGLSAATGAAFAGVNPLVGQGEFILPVGQSGYDALQMVLKQQKNHPAPGITNANIQVSYSLSRVVSDAGVGASGGTADQFFNSGPWDEYDPKSYTGRNTSDHSNEVSFGGTFTFKYGPILSITGQFLSAAPTSLQLPSNAAVPTTTNPGGTNPTNAGAGEIFRTDVSGDGTTADLVPGTQPGAYMHGVKPQSLGKFINNYNATQAGTLTPAGQALVNAGLFNISQLATIGAVKPALQNAPANGPLPNAAFRNVNFAFSYPIKLGRFHEGLSIVPGVAMYNAANLANFGRLSGVLQDSTSASSTRLNGTNSYAVEDGLRVQRGSGTFDQGGPRTTEFQLKLNY